MKHDHPTYRVMVLAAIQALTEKGKRKGTPPQSIYRYIYETYELPDTNTPKTLAKNALAALYEEGVVKKPNAYTYRLKTWPSDVKKKKKKVVKKKKKTAKRKKRKSLKSESKVKRSKKKKRASKAKKIVEKRKKAVKKSRKRC